MRKTLVLIFLIVLSSNTTGKPSKDDNKLIAVGEYPRNKILIPIDNGQPPIKKIYIDLHINVTEWDKYPGIKLFQIEQDFLRKVRSEFNKTKPKLKLLKVQGHPSLGTIHMEPRNKHEDIIKNASSLGVMKVKILYSDSDGQYYASVNKADYDIPLYSTGTMSNYWLGKSESLNKILFGVVYDKVFNNLVESNCFLIEKEITKCFKLNVKQPKPKKSVNLFNETVISLALKYKIHKAKASDIKIIKSYKKDGRKVMILKIKNSVCDMPMIKMDGKWSATGISCKG